MLVGTLGLVVTFGASSKLAAAYGIAVSGTMVITTILITVVARRRWGWSMGKVGLVFGSFMLVDSGFFVANVLKIPQGGWVSLGLACLLLLLMSTWSGGRHLVARCLWNKMPPLSSFIGQIQSDGVRRVPGWAIYMSSTPELAPPALVQNVRHNKAVHQELLFLTVHTVRVPWLPVAEQVHVERLNEHVFRLTMRHGFMQIPEIPKVLPACAASGLTIPLSDATYFLSRISALATPLPGMVLWREGLFIFLEKISQRASSYFHLPADQVVEIGIVIEI